MVSHHPEEGGLMNCPKCNAPMEEVSFESITVDRCTSCKGIWFDANEHKLLKDKRGAEALDIGDVNVGKRMDKITNILCPRCHGPMIRMVDVDQQHIDYEACTTCYGVFLDAGEFRDFKDFTVSEYLRGLFGLKKKK
jgi:Zn-finger nucleic acid-binding protein